MPNSIVDSDPARHGWHTNGEDGYRIHKHTPAVPSGAIRAHVDRAPTVFPRKPVGRDPSIRRLAQHGNYLGVFGSRQEWIKHRWPRRTQPVDVRCGK